MSIQELTEGQLLDLFRETCAVEEVRSEDFDTVLAMLAPLRSKGPVYRAHYMHSLRVALYANSMGQLWELDSKLGYLNGRALLLAGALHDIGKAQVPIEVLGKEDNWTSEDQRLVRRHVVDGYRMVRGRFDFSGAIMLWHHRFQAQGYPKRMPRSLVQFAHTSKRLIHDHGRMLALADVFDALHRKNGKHGGLTPREIKIKMLQYNPDMKPYIAALYDIGILQTR